jgi:hypothetical protein
VEVVSVQGVVQTVPQIPQGPKRANVKAAVPDRKMRVDDMHSTHTASALMLTAIVVCMAAVVTISSWL